MIELYNGNDYEINLYNYGLSDTSGSAKWSFSDVTIEPKSYLVVFLSGERMEGLYASFKLSSSGDGVWTDGVNYCYSSGISHYIFS